MSSIRSISSARSLLRRTRLQGTLSHRHAIPTSSLPPPQSKSRFMSSTSSTSSSSSSPAPTRVCPSCSAPIPIPSSPCPSCSALIPFPSGLSYHSLLSLSSPIPTSASSPPALTLFDIPAELSTLPAHGYDLDPRELRARMLARQRDLHPDRHGAGAGGGDVELAKELSGRVNRAYEVLANPLRRAEYILSIHNKGTQETDAVTDPELLMEIMEARETLEDASSAEEIERLREENHTKVTAVIDAIKAAFSEIPPNISKAKELSVELKYWVGLEEAAKEKL